MKGWDRILWGVRFTSPGENPMMLGADWYRGVWNTNTGYPGEPSHALLFKTRKYAREYCAAQMASYAARGDICSKWKFAPVRVRELITCHRGK